MKKISVITMHCVKNYGSVLQTYATQSIFESLGYDVEFVDFWRKDLVDNNLVSSELAGSHSWNKNPITRLAFKSVKGLTARKRIKVFNAFLNSNIHTTRKRYYSIEELRASPPEADVYCTGSDQMWNSDYNGGILKPFFLEYAPKGKPRIAYSASFGKARLDEWEKEDTKQLLKKYSAISVREKSGVEILNDLGLKGIHLLDPTLVLDASAWKSIISRPLLDKKYILSYQLGKNKDFDSYAKSFAKMKGMPLIRIGFYKDKILKPGKMFNMPSVEDFLSLFYHSEYIITNSFHGTAFSINFNKKFAVIYPQRYITRLQSILQFTGLENHVVTDYNDFSYFDKEIDYVKVNAVLKEQRNKTKAFLQYALGCK